MKQRIISMCLALALVFAMLPKISISSNAAQADEISYEMREEVIEFKLSDGTLYYSNTVYYPYFLGNSAAENIINDRYATIIAEYKNNTTDYDALYQEVLEWSPDGVNGLPFYDDISAEVTYCSNGIISIKECSTMWSGGMHPYSDYAGYTYSVNEGTELSLIDILSGSENEIKNLINRYNQGAASYYKAELIMASPFMLMSDGLCFLCNVGDAVPREEIVIPFTEADAFAIFAERESVSAETIASGTSKEGFRWELDSAGILTISGEGTMEDYFPAGGGYTSWIDANLGYSYNDQIKKIILSHGITNIGNAAFDYCRNLISVEIPDTVLTIGDYAFLCCFNLESVIIPDSVTTIGLIAFQGCEKLTNIIIPRNVDSIGDGAFAGCDELRSITFVGDSPVFGDGEYMPVFEGVNATVYYPHGNPTWTADVMQNYGGILTWTAEESSDSDFIGSFNEFMEQKAYQPYWMSAVSEYTPPTQYSFIDINKDGNQELIICSDNDFGFYLFSVFEYHKDTNIVTPLPIPAPGYEIHSCYGGLEYSDMYSAIVFTETNDGTAFGGLAYYSMSDGTLSSCFHIGFENYDGNGAKYYTSEEANISEEKYFEYIFESVAIDFSPIVDFVPVENLANAYEDYARTEWIEQHMEYAASDEYQSEIVGGYNGRMLAVFRDALDDGGIGSYRLAKNTSKMLGLDFELSETEMYELILAEILYSRTSFNMGTEAYKENYNKALQDVAKLLVTVANVADGSSKIPKDALNSINDLYAVLKTLSTDSPDFDSTYSQFAKLIKENVSETDLIKGFKSDATFTAIGIVVDGLFETYDSLEDILQYISNYVAYQSTSQQLKEVLMRLSVVVLYEYEGLYGVEELEELDIWDAMVNWGDFSAAIVSFLTVLADYEQDGAAAVAEYAVERAKEGGQKFGDKAIKSVVVFGLDTIASKIPVLNAIVLAKNVLNVGVLVTEVLTNVDEREYALDMLTKIYCISVALDKVVDDCADAMNENDFYASTVFDESVNVYSGTQLLASDFALKYADMVLANAEEDLYNYDEGWGIDHLFNSREKMVAIVEWYSNSYKMLEEQRSEIQSIACHDSDLSYNQTTDEIIYHFKDSRIYIVACPVNVIVKNEAGEQIAHLSGENNQIIEGYEFYFHTIKATDDSGEYIKVAIVPDGYQVELVGTDDGTMNVFVTDFTSGDVGEVETYFNIPIEKDSVGYFEVSSENTNESSLVMDRVAYFNMESVEDIPTDSEGNGVWIWIVGGTIACGIILVVILKKKSRK